MSPESPRLRLGILAIVAVSLFAALFARLWFLQVMAAPTYRVAAAENQRRVIVEEAPRGRILDRNGKVIVDNRSSIVVSVDRAKLRELDEPVRDRALSRLAEELTRYGKAMTFDDVKRRLNDLRYGPYSPVPVAEDVPEELQLYLSERREIFTEAVIVESKAVRHYPFGRLGTHLIGYVGPINEEELAARNRDTVVYQPGDEIGKSGVERSYEDQLRGQPGRRELEVDSRGNLIRQLSYTPPVPGNDLQLTIDATIQAVAEQALREELESSRGRAVRFGPRNKAPAGSVVVLDPRSGGVVALASNPDYDPATFVNGIDSAEWASLNDPNNHYPLANRAIQGEYPPGSTFKLITAYSALASGAITPETTVNDRGSYKMPRCDIGKCVFRNAGSKRYGIINLSRALTISSDVFFYELGARFWFERDLYGFTMQRAAESLGFGADTGIPLPAERDGYIPTPDKKKALHESNAEAFPEGKWYAGDNVNLAVGQGDMLATPMQLANAYGALANGGTLYTPNVVAKVLAPYSEKPLDVLAPRILGTVDLKPSIRQPILDGLAGVTSGDGTAALAFRDFPSGWPVAGKTGTAQVGTKKADTALFVGFGPLENPQYVAVAVLEESGFGGVAAAPVVRRILAPLADPALMPELQPDGTLSEPLPEGTAGGGVD